MEREQITLSVWPPSPKQPFRDDDEIEADRKASKRKAKKAKSSRRSKRRSKRYYDSDNTASETDSEQEGRRRKQRREKEKDRERRKRYSSDENEDDRRRKRGKSVDTGRSEDDAADQWVEKDGEVVLAPKEEDLARLEPPPIKYEDEYEDDEVGPRLPVEHGGRDRLDRSAFTNLLRGEGEAMAAFVASGQRIPRRGEIGLESDQIQAFEQMGYVMSGSRHRRMNAVRMRKENQVINAEEKRAILNLQREEKQKKEGMIISQFKEMMEENLKRQGIERP